MSPIGNLATTFTQHAAPQLGDAVGQLCEPQCRIFTRNMNRSSRSFSTEPFEYTKSPTTCPVGSFGRPRPQPRKSPAWRSTCRLPDAPLPQDNPLAVEAPAEIKEQVPLLFPPLDNRMARSGDKPFRSTLPSPSSLHLTPSSDAYRLLTAGTPLPYGIIPQYLPDNKYCHLEPAPPAHEDGTHAHLECIFR